VGRAVTARRDLLKRQRRWAETYGLPCDARGYVRELRDNLREPLRSRVLVEFQRGSELVPGHTRPARMCSVSSSAALVANVFAYWHSRDLRPLVAALGLDGGAMRLSFEEPLPTGLEGDAPTADVALFWPSGRIASIESKFGEWLVRRPRHKAVFKPKYFPPGEGIWAAQRLPACQALAADLQTGRERFKLLHAAQLLKHALGLACSGASRWTLMYLYYDWPAREAEVHRVEVDRFVGRLRGEIDFRVLTYQTLYAALCGAANLDDDYLTYLARRYFR
jgi:hypothetical protein